MVGKTTATAPEKARMATIKEHMPCVPCLLKARRPRLPSVQHVVEGMKRLGHDFTYASCDWHHFGHCGEWTRQQCFGLLGPSLAHGKRSFQADFGPERVLVKVQGFLLAEFVDDPWLDYNVPYTVRRQAIELWRNESECLT